MFSIPADEEWYAIFMDALQALTSEWQWYQNGTLTPAEAAAAMSVIIDNAYDLAEMGVCATEVETPYWDDATDVEVSEPAETQTWYGEVTNPTAPPAELDFVENLLIWGFTGLIALATVEVGAAPAILFNTIAPKFVLAMKRGDIGEVFRIVVDGQDAARVDTTPYSEGDIIKIPVIPADESLSSHNLLIIGELP